MFWTPFLSFVLPLPLSLPSIHPPLFILLLYFFLSFYASNFFLVFILGQLLSFFPHAVLSFLPFLLHFLFFYSLIFLFSLSLLSPSPLFLLFSWQLSFISQQKVPLYFNRSQIQQQCRGPAPALQPDRASISQWRNSNPKALGGNQPHQPGAII